MLGIDVSKDSLTCTLLDSISHNRLWELTVPNSVRGVERLLRRAPSDVPWVLEPTGRYSLSVAQHAQAAGRTVLLAQPKRAKKYLESLQERAKTDRLDSYGLSLYALTHKLRIYPLKSAMLEQLDQLLAARKGLSQALSSLQQRVRELPHAAPVLQEAIAGLHQQRAQLDRQIHALTAAPPATTPPATTPPATTPPATPSPTADPVQPKGTAALAAVAGLQKVPGIGPVTAATVASRLGARDFAHPDAFVAYCGLDVKINQSGRRKGQRGLTKQGDAELRRLLYLAAQASLRAKNSPFRGQYERELAKGLPTTGALCAVARKLARLCWSLVTHGSTYDAERVYRSPAQLLHDPPQPRTP